MIELVTSQFLWAHDVDEAGVPHLAGEAAMRPVESRAVYNTIREALLQAAHNEIVTPGMDQRIEQNGNKLLGKREIKEAAKRLESHRKDSGLNPSGTHYHYTYDAAGELKVIQSG